MKGGVGKTTLAQNLGWYAAHEHDLSVLVVDLDPQFNVSQYLMGSSTFRKRIIEENQPTIVDVFEVDRPRLGRQPAGKAPEPSPIVNIRDWGVDGRLDLLPSRLEFAWTLRNSAQKERHLVNFLSRRASHYDLILLDCPPTESMATQAAYLASQFVLVPIKPEFLATIGLPLLATSLATFHDTYPEHRVEVAGIVFNDVGDSYEHARAKDDVMGLAAEHGWYVFKNQVTHSNSYPKGARERQSIMSTDYARYTKRDEFRDFGAEFLGRVGVASKVPAR